MKEKRERKKGQDEKEGDNEHHVGSVYYGYKNCIFDKNKSRGTFGQLCYLRKKYFYIFNLFTFTTKGNSTSTPQQHNMSKVVLRQVN